MIGDVLSSTTIPMSSKWSCEEDSYLITTVDNVHDQGGKWKNVVSEFQKKYPERSFGSIQNKYDKLRKIWKHSDEFDPFKIYDISCYHQSQFHELLHTNVSPKKILSEEELLQPFVDLENDPVLKDNY